MIKMHNAFTTFGGFGDCGKDIFGFPRWMLDRQAQYAEWATTGLSTF
jgi:hypothetical protein